MDPARWENSPGNGFDGFNKAVKPSKESMGQIGCPSDTFLAISD
jgi:hypothetical protein